MLPTISHNIPSNNVESITGFLDGIPIACSPRLDEWSHIVNQHFACGIIKIQPLFLNAPAKLSTEFITDICLALCEETVE
jgi:hypothetical protein